METNGAPGEGTRPTIARKSTCVGRVPSPGAFWNSQDENCHYGIGGRANRPRLKRAYPRKRPLQIDLFQGRQWHQTQISVRGRWLKH